MPAITPVVSSQIVLVDDKDRVVGFKEKFAAHKNPVPLHRAISIVIFNKDKTEILITKRSRKKFTWPKVWSNTVCSHPQPEESYSQAAERRLFEEVGFKTPLKQVFKFSYKARMNKQWGEHEMDAVFIGKYEGRVSPNPDEIEGFEWIKVKDLKRELKKTPKKYTPWFKLIADRLI